MHVFVSVPVSMCALVYAECARTCERVLVRALVRSGTMTEYHSRRSFSPFGKLDVRTAASALAGERLFGLQTFHCVLTWRKGSDSSVGPLV